MSALCLHKTQQSSVTNTENVDMQRRLAINADSKALTKAGGDLIGRKHRHNKNMSVVVSQSLVKSRPMGP